MALRDGRHKTTVLVFFSASAWTGLVAAKATGSPGGEGKQRPRVLVEQFAQEGIQGRITPLQ